MAQAIRIPRWLKWTGVSLAVLIVLVLIIASVMDRFLRGYVERYANQKLEGQGYHLRVGKLDIHPLSLSLDIEDVAFIQADRLFTRHRGPARAARDAVERHQVLDPRHDRGNDLARLGRLRDPGIGVLQVEEECPA